MDIDREISGYVRAYMENQFDQATQTGRRNSTAAIPGTGTGTNKSSVAREEAVDTYRPAVKHGKTHVKQRKSKLSKVHPSKKFRALVEKVLEQSEIHGTLSALYTGLVIDDGNIPSNKQYFVQGFDFRVAVANLGTNTSTAPTPWSFTPDQFNIVASGLWNTYGFNNNVDQLYDPDTAGKFNFANTKLHVKSCSTHYLMKNSTYRVLTLRIFLCAPRHAFAYNPRQLDNVTAASAVLPVYTGGTNAISQATMQSPLQCFLQSAALDQASNRVDINGAAEVDGVTQSCGIHVVPNDFPTFRACYKTEYTEVVLQPGQSYSYSIPGPKSLDIDFASYNEGVVYNNVRPYSRCPLILVRQDILSGVVTAEDTRVYGGRYASAAGYNVNSGLLVERTDYYSMKMPEMTGGATSITAGTTTNTLLARKNNHMKYQFNTPETITVIGADVIPEEFNAQGP